MQSSWLALLIAALAAPTPAPLPLGCADVGIFSDLDSQVSLSLPALSRPRLVVDAAHHTLVVYDHDWPVKVYPTGEGVEAFGVLLRPADAAELARHAGAPLQRLTRGQRLAPGDRDADGIPDPLDVLVGGKKLVANRAAYTGAYYPLDFPGGDPPRDAGSCADVLVRSLRNAGLDLQAAVSADIARRPRAYPMVKKPNRSIDHRRVRTLLPYFLRHFASRQVALDDAADPYRPGDVLFMDTLPSKSGPDHVGIVSDQRGGSGHLLVINNWTDGTVDAEMDLLGSVPVTHRFRLR
jgi:uncharacterized protein YijF (DUF1287 family)